LVRNASSPGNSGKTKLVASIETGGPAMKFCETLSAVADGKLGDVEILHAQASQLVLYPWQFLPRLSAGSVANAQMLHQFYQALCHAEW
jgi:hypothetical protein